MLLDDETTSRREVIQAALGTGMAATLMASVPRRGRAAPAASGPTVDWMTIEDVEAELGVLPRSWGAEVGGCGNRQTGRIYHVIVELTEIPGVDDDFGDGEGGPSMSGNVEIWLERDRQRRWIDWWFMGADLTDSGKAAAIGGALEAAAWHLRTVPGRSHGMIIANRMRAPTAPAPVLLR